MVSDLQLSTTWRQAECWSCKQRAVVLAKAYVLDICDSYTGNLYYSYQCTCEDLLHVTSMRCLIIPLLLLLLLLLFIYIPLSRRSAIWHLGMKLNAQYYYKRDYVKQPVVIYQKQVYRCATKKHSVSNSFITKRYSIFISSW